MGHPILYFRAGWGWMGCPGASGMGLPRTGDRCDGRHLSKLLVTVLQLIPGRDMGRVLRNLAVVLFGALASVLTVAVLVYLEAKNGQPLFSYALWTYVPVGAVLAGLAGALGYALGAAVLRTRPMNLVAPVIVLVAFGTVYMARSAEFSLFLGAKDTTKDAATFGGFLANSAMHSQLHYFDSSSSGGDDSGSGGGSGGSGMVGAASDSNSHVSGMADGVQGMLAAPDVTNSGAAKQLTRVDGDMQALGSSVTTHGSQLVLMVLEGAGFALGGLLMFGMLRRLSHCEDCQVFLAKKGEQVRYFDNSDKMQDSLNGFMTRVRDRRYKQLIEEHRGQGTASAGRFSAFSSAIEIRRCAGCEKHRLKFSARRKDKNGWKEIGVLGQTAFSMEPLDLARG